MLLQVSPPAHYNTNSYITLTEAESYFLKYARVPASNSWYNLTTEQKEYALILAAYALNTLKYKGKKITKTQPLAFPRYSWSQLNDEDYAPFISFDLALEPINLTILCYNTNVTITNNTFILPNNISNSKIKNLSIIKTEGFTNSENNGYFTVKSYNDNSITVAETVTDETSSSVTIYLTKLFGISNNIKYAQAEVAWQVINSDVFQKEISETETPLLRIIQLGSALRLHYSNVFSALKFNTNSIIPRDIIYLLLSEWISSVGGGIV